RHERDGDGGRRSQTRTGRRVVVQSDLEPLGELLMTPKIIQHALRKIELPIVYKGVIDAIADALVVINAADDKVLAPSHNRRRGESIDGGAQHDAATLITVRRHICTTSTEADAQWRARTDQHHTASFCFVDGVAVRSCAKTSSIIRAVRRISAVAIGAAVRSTIDR